MEKPWLTHDRVVRCLAQPADPQAPAPPLNGKVSIRVRHRLRMRTGLVLMEESTGYPASWIIGRLIELQSSSPPVPKGPDEPDGTQEMAPEEEALRDSLRDERGTPSPVPTETINQFVPRQMLLGGVINDPIGDYFDQGYILKEEQVTALETFAKSYQLTPDQAVDFLLARELWHLAQGWLPT